MAACYMFLSESKWLSSWRALVVAFSMCALFPLLDYFAGYINVGRKFAVGMDVVGT